MIVVNTRPVPVGQGIDIPKNLWTEIHFPLGHIVPIKYDLPNDYDAVIVTSQYGDVVDHPMIWRVGDQAPTVRQLIFEIINHYDSPKTFLYPCGENISAHFAAALTILGHTIIPVVVYRTQLVEQWNCPLIYQKNPITNLGILLTSRRCAVHYMQQIVNKPLNPHHLFCISHKVASVLPQSDFIHVASHPSMDSLYSVVKDFYVKKI